jgi:hypothetical protein
MSGAGRAALDSKISFESIVAFAALQGAIASLVLVDLVNPLAVQLFGTVCLGILACVALLAWIQTEQGNHPVFLFMVFLGVFQFGRMFSWLVAGEWTISWFDLAVSRPFTVPADELKHALLMVPLSASFVYLGFFGSNGRKVLTFARNDEMRSFFGWLYLFTIPFVIFKDVSYLRYALEHGGYLATYLGQGEHTEQVGLPIRAMALLNTAAFLPYLILESRRRLLWITIGSYLAVLVLELLVGLRGKFFINVMFLWMIYNIKTGSSFKPVTAAAGALLLVGAAVAAEIFRESKSALDVNLVEYFFYTQGNSFFVTVSSVIFNDVFAGNAIDYLLNQFILPYRHVSKFGEGELLTLDLTTYLNPAAAKFGFGTGDAYLANLYLLGGYAAVSGGSFVLGAFCSRINRVQSMFGRTIALSIFLWIPYLPRSGYMEPLATSIKYAVVAAAGFLLYAVFSWLRHCLSGTAMTSTSRARSRS